VIKDAEYAENIRKRFINEGVIGIILFGSTLTSSQPRDLDLLVLIRDGYRRFRVIEEESHPIEIEYVPLKFFYLFLNKYYWWPHNWEMEMGKYAHGRILYDPLNEIKNFRKKILPIPKHIWLYFLMHRTGRCVHHLEKLSGIQDKEHIEFSLHYADFFREFILLLLLIQEKYPNTTRITMLLDNNTKKNLQNIFHSMSVDCCWQLLEDYIRKNSKKIQDFISKNRRPVPMKYIEDIKGAKYIYKLTNLKIAHFTKDTSLSSLGGWKGNEYIPD